MLGFVLLAQALAADARLVWRGGVGRVEIVAPGEHVSPDAPTTVRVGELRVETRGDPAALRFPVAGGPLDVEVTLALCTDGSTACRPVRFGARGAAAGRRGEIALVEGGSFADGAAPGGARGGFGRTDALPENPGLTVLDFGAVWCPPCNRMEAEVLRDPAGTVGIPVETIDVDRPESWPLKDRYAVTGYPTLVAVDAEGREIDRLVGYPGAAETRAWFARLDDGLLPIHRLAEAALDPKSDTLTGAFASGAARRLAEAERHDAARALFARAADGVDLRVARLLVEPTEADARWLFAHDAPPGDWVFTAVDTVPALWAEAAALAPAVDPVRGADLLYVAAEHAPAEAGPALHAASLALLRAALTGDPDKDRGHATFQATLLVETGDLDGAVALLDAHAARWPDEFTFAYA
ncbi:MAG: TlpA family protein disulfide reductase, partial [Myxococcota bacterium]